MRKLTGAEVRDMRKAHRCPDCRSEVDVNRRTAHVEVRHDTTCPMYATLQRTGRTSALVFVRQPNETPEAFNADVAAFTAELSRITGRRYAVGNDPYRGTTA